MSEMYGCVACKRDIVVVAPFAERTLTVNNIDKCDVMRLTIITCTRRAYGTDLRAWLRRRLQWHLLYRMHGKSSYQRVWVQILEHLLNLESRSRIWFTRACGNQPHLYVWKLIAERICNRRQWCCVYDGAVQVSRLFENLPELNYWKKQI